MTPRARSPFRFVSFFHFVLFFIWQGPNYYSLDRLQQVTAVMSEEEAEEEVPMLVPAVSPAESRTRTKLENMAGKIPVTVITGFLGNTEGIT